MSWAGRSAGVLLAATMVVSATACTADSDGDGGEQAGSCALQFTYEGRTYRDVANVDFAIADKLGTATKPPCDDTGGQDEAEGAGTTETAYKVNGISPTVAIAVGETPEEAIFVASYSGSKLPPEVQKLIDGP
ncbi:DUF6281 family protein [Streptomyces sp. NPDC057137]|uniref:DUF6281 family protein n=1 Tax=Streptomyces sp. NPDC057137 TaxID=3346030 RepID=UPI0036391D94